MIITVSGPSGAGKTSVAGRLSEELKMPAIDVGGVFREVAAQHDMDIVQFSDYRLKHPEIDRQIDDQVIDRCQASGGCVLQGRLSGWMTKRRDVEAVRIWIDASPAVRASRIIKREGGDQAEVLAGINRRDGNDWRNYKDTYGIDLNDMSVYDIVVPTDNLSVEEVVSFILRELQKYG